jgi:hypothetical protein
VSPGKRCDEIIRIIDELLCDQPRLAGASAGLMTGSPISIAAAGRAPREETHRGRIQALFGDDSLD